MSGLHEEGSSDRGVRGAIPGREGQALGTDQRRHGGALGGRVGGGMRSSQAARGLPPEVCRVSDLKRLATSLLSFACCPAASRRLGVTHWSGFVRVLDPDPQPWAMMLSRPPLARLEQRLHLGIGRKPDAKVFGSTSRVSPVQNRIPTELAPFRCGSLTLAGGHRERPSG
jgi:hypothetical protein